MRTGSWAPFDRNNTHCRCICSLFFVARSPKINKKKICEPTKSNRDWDYQLSYFVNIIIATIISSPILWHVAAPISTLFFLLLVRIIYYHWPFVISTEVGNNNKKKQWIKKNETEKNEYIDIKMPAIDITRLIFNSIGSVWNRLVSGENGVPALFFLFFNFHFFSFYFFYVKILCF